MSSPEILDSAMNVSWVSSECSGSSSVVCLDA